MIREPVVSSTIRAIGYDAARSILEVEFQPGKYGTAPVWQYEDVPPQTAEELLAAQSIGSFFAANVKKAGFSARRIATVQPDGSEIPTDAVIE